MDAMGVSTDRPGLPWEVEHSYGAQAIRKNDAAWRRYVDWCNGIYDPHDQSAVAQYLVGLDGAAHRAARLAIAYHARFTPADGQPAVALRRIVQDRSWREFTEWCKAARRAKTDWASAEAWREHLQRTTQRHHIEITEALSGVAHHFRGPRKSLVSPDVIAHQRTIHRQYLAWAGAAGLQSAEAATARKYLNQIADAGRHEALVRTHKVAIERFERMEIGQIRDRKAAVSSTYSSAAKRYKSWCRAEGLKPKEPKSLRLYLEHLERAGRSSAYIGTIRHAVRASLG